MSRTKFAADILQEALKSIENVNGTEYYVVNFKYDFKDLVLFALGVGATASKETDLKYIYEGHHDFDALPSFFIIAGLSFESPLTIRAMPSGKYIDYDNSLHGEQYIEFLDNYPDIKSTKFNTTELVCRTRLVDILDKGTNAVSITNSDVYLKGKLVFRTQQHMVILNQGGFNGPRKCKESIEIQNVPDRKPDAVVEQKTSDIQSAIYRLSGDYNPLHIDQETAQSMGYQNPILHGLSSLGFSVRHVLAKYASNNPSYVKAIKARFAKPVFPGQTLVTEMWSEENRIHFQTRVKETNELAITGAYIDLKSMKHDNLSNNEVSTLKCDALFHNVVEKLKNSTVNEYIKSTILFDIIENGKLIKQWTIDLKTQKVYDDKPTSIPDCTITITDDDLVRIAKGTLNSQEAYFKRKLKIRGKVSFKLIEFIVSLIKVESKL